jgi:hypothetical protein
VIRGSSIPQTSSGNSSGEGRSVGTASMTHPSMPFADRAAHRCEIPRRSSTLQSSRVVPSCSVVAPALKTVWAGYGQSAAVRIGFFSCRWNRVS